MRMRWMLVALLAAVLGAAPAHASKSDKKLIKQLRADLVGQSMGGREKCWSFQSVKQILSLEIDERVEERDRRIYDVSLQLCDDPARGTYDARARMTYERDGSRWELKHVGLLWLSCGVPHGSSRAGDG